MKSALLGLMGRDLIGRHGIGIRRHVAPATTIIFGIGAPLLPVGILPTAAFDHRLPSKSRKLDGTSVFFVQLRKIARTSTTGIAGLKWRAGDRKGKAAAVLKDLAGGGLALIHALAQGVRFR
jgi:hypothetical protein